ncbi:IucA/IucC family protein [Brevibacillus migulae]|uniref:IucA/IucC family protein n=1 Tax=Brevibacillus migulae TaxID=1644114 RepID=UPI0014317FCB|nr:IucA/IucC family protein [Brevibacillus migulae]
MSMTDYAVLEAERRVMEDLVNALLAEQFFEENALIERLSPAQWEALQRRDSGMNIVEQDWGPDFKEADVYHWRLQDDQDAAIVFPVYPAIVQPYRYEASAAVYEVRVGQDERVDVKKLGPVDFMRHIIRFFGDDPATIDTEGAEQFVHMLEQTLLQSAWSLANKQPGAGILGLPTMASFLRTERKASFRDRPFHPVSKVKLGWGQEECSRYTAEYGQAIQLRWMAVKRDYLISGQPDQARWEAVSQLLLSEEERGTVQEELDRRELDSEAYIPIPVHPWQMTTILPEKLDEEIKAGICVPLQVKAGTFYATSSVRSLMSEQSGRAHVKLPLGIQSLGGLRYLSAIKLMNGQKAESLMRQGMERDPVLKQRLFLCDETNWWAYLPESRDLFADYPRHLSAMVRQYPQALVEDEAVRLLPMSALAVYDRTESGHLFDEWLREIGREQSEAAILQLLRDVCLTYFEICFRLFRLGMMPEIHGQNSVLVWKHGKIEGLLLRDHDALRLHVPWLEANGLEDPVYTLRAGYPNSLYHASPHKLLTFFQMLGIQVNCSAILQALSQYYGIKEERLWRELRECLEQAMKSAALPEEVRNVLHECLLEKETWPWKQVIRPLVKQHLRVPGSMPFGQGEVPNPLLAKATAFGNV